MVKVIASSLRKGNVVEQDGNLHVILTAENVHPGKGNSVTNVTMRRISDGVKVIGRWRTVEQAGPVDASGTFVDGTPIDGVVALRNVLLQHSDAFRTTVTEKLLDYAAGRPVNASRFTPETLVRARQILREMKPVRWSSLIAAVVRATPEPGR